MAPRPRVITCQGASSTARLAAEVALELESAGVSGPVVDVVSASTSAESDGGTIALDGCRSACGSRLAAARGVRLVAALSLADLGVSAEDAGLADPRTLAARAAWRLGRDVAPPQPTRPHRHGPSRAPTSGHAHTVEDYLLALDALTSPVVECGAVVTDAPTLASHVSDALGVSRATAGEMLHKMESGGLVRRGRRKELLLSREGRAQADASVRRQRLLEVFATRSLGYELAESYERARLLRGAFDDDAIGRLEQQLGFPERCPHGWPVDAARAREESKLLHALPSLPIGDPAQIARLAEDDAVALRLLAAHKVLPGVELAVKAVMPSGGLQLDVGGRNVELEKAGVEAVLVRPLLPSV